jgi:molybdopterin-guanine dinucleotide biosynthesis protein A
MLPDGLGVCIGEADGGSGNLRVVSRASKLARAGFVLAGGQSSRMGANKAFLEFDGQTLLARALGVLKEACGSAVIVGDPAVFSGFDPSGFDPVIADVFPGCGPLAGIHAALVTHSMPGQFSAELNAMLAVDMPYVSAELIGFLLGVAEESGAVVTVPRIDNGLQPLCAIYRREFAVAAESSLRVGKFKIDVVFADLPLRVVEGAELAAAGFSAKHFLNVNTPEEWRAAGNPGVQR